MAKTTGRAAAALPETLHPEQRLKAAQVFTLIGYGRSKTYAEIAAGRFPAPERRGARCSRWRVADVLAWLSAQQANKA